MQFQFGPVVVSLIDEGDRLVERETPTFEQVSREMWAAMVVPGTIAFDVGAYSGMYAIAAAKLGAHAIAVEPNPNMQQRILDNAQRNGVTVDLIKAGASDKDGKAQLLFYEPTSCMGSFDPRDPVSNPVSSPSRWVETKRMDNMARPPRLRVSAIKMDVERHEVEAIKGAKNILTYDRPALLVEVLKHPPNQMAVVTDELLKNDYQLTESLPFENNYVFAYKGGMR